MNEFPIKIISLPGGRNPEWVRQAWIGLCLSAYQLNEVRRNQSPDDHYHVNTIRALEVLRKSNPEAYKWWLKEGHATAIPTLRFRKSICELLQ